MKEHTVSLLTAEDLGSSLLRAQKALGWVTMIFLLAAFVSLVDGLTAEMQRGPNRLDVLPGSVTPLSGPIPVKNPTTEDFQVQGNAPDGQVRIELDDFFSSYWFGSGMWRGRLVVGDKPGIGEYHLVVEFEGASVKSAQNYRVDVWGDERSMREGSFSRLTRETGFSPFWAAGCIFPVGLFGAVINFFMGRSRANRMLRKGCAEIYKVAKGKEKGLEATFGMGERHSVFLGQECEIMRQDGSVVCRGTVALCERGYASMLLPLDAQVVPGHVARPLMGETPKAHPTLMHTGAPLAPKGVLHG